MTWSSAASSGWSSPAPMPVRGPLVGWRAWRVTAAAGGLHLSSAVFDELWEPRLPLAAACPKPHRAPAQECVCGLYGVRAPAAAVRYLVGRDDPRVVHRVVGEVALWGVTVVAEGGWRAAWAAPLRLVVPSGRTSGRPVDASAVAAELAAGYGVTAEVVDAAEPASLAGALAA